MGLEWTFHHGDQGKQRIWVSSLGELQLELQKGHIFGVPQQHTALKILMQGLGFLGFGGTRPSKLNQPPGPIWVSPFISLGQPEKSPHPHKNGLLRVMISCQSAPVIWNVYP